MSYDIVFDRQFIKTLDGRIIPLVLIGCNNLTTTNANGREVIVKSWSPMLTGSNRNPAFAPEDLMNKAKSFTGGEYQEHFKRGSNWVNDAAFIRFFKNGIKQAKTLAELRDEGVHISSLSAYFSVWDNSVSYSHSTEGHMYLHTDEEILAFLETADKRLAVKKENESIYICLEFPTVEPLKHPMQKRKLKERLSEFYTVESGGFYISRLTRNGLHRTYTTAYAKQFSTQKAAEKWLDKYHITSRFPKLSFSVEKISA